MVNAVLRELFDKERDYLNQFFEHFDLQKLETVLQAIIDCKGMIILTGVGKSGLIAEKIAMTMTSTGTQAVFLCPTNALHGDIGIVRKGDLFVALSKSGESEEILNLIPFVKNKGAKVVGIVNNCRSRLAKAVDILVDVQAVQELCPFDMVPTTSTTVQTIIGDVLTVALMRLKNFSLDEYASIHPAGKIGKRITMRVKDLMLKDQCLPVCKKEDKLVDVLVELSNKQCGCVMVVGGHMELEGIFTDGDLRRSLQTKGVEALELKMADLMTHHPRSIKPDALAWDALKEMEADQKRPVTVLAVVGEDKKLVGAIKMHDIVQSGV